MMSAGIQKGAVKTTRLIMSENASNIPLISPYAFPMTGVIVATSVAIAIVKGFFVGFILLECRCAVNRAAPGRICSAEEDLLEQ